MYDPIIQRILGEGIEVESMSKQDRYGFDTEQKRAEYCLDRSESAKNRGRNSAATFWRKEAAEAALKALKEGVFDE